MKFRIYVTSGEEVIFTGYSRIDMPAYHGGLPETGLWRINITKFESFIASILEPLSFGSSINEFVFGLEIAELDEWGIWFNGTRDYMSYRPKNKMFISVGQIEWKEVKDLTAAEQLAVMIVALMSSIERMASAKRKPKGFDHAAFAQAVRGIVTNFDAKLVRVCD